jgi:choice-of-anchor A domain-containing protein
MAHAVFLVNHLLVMKAAMFIKWSFIPEIAIPSLANAAGVLGAADGYNVFTKGNFWSQYSDTEGKMAVVGNLTANGYSIGIKSGSSETNVQVKGNLNFSNGSINGKSLVDGAANVSSANTGGIGKGVTIDFDSAFNDLSKKSASWFNLTANGVVTKPYSTLNFIGHDAKLNVFNIDGDALWNASDIKFDVAAGSTVLVNVTGKNVKFKNYGYGLNNLSRTNLLWNVADATTVNYDYLEGSLLATKADVTTGWGVINGQVISNSWSGNSQINNYTFSGNLPTQPVPEPATIAVLSLGAAAIMKRRKKA